MGGCQILQPPRFLLSLCVVGGPGEKVEQDKGLWDQRSRSAAAGASVAAGPVGCDTGAGHRGAGACHPLSLHRSPPAPSCSPGQEGAAPRGLRTALPLSPHPGAPLPAPRPPCSCSAPSPWRSVAGAAHRAAPFPLVAVTVSARRGTLGTETAPAAPCPSPRCCGREGTVAPRPGSPKRRHKVAQDPLPPGPPAEPPPHARPARLPVLFLRSTMFYFSAEIFVQS